MSIVFLNTSDNALKIFQSSLPSPGGKLAFLAS